MLRSFVLLLLFCPLFSHGFSETEIDSLESGGTKIFSGSAWRTELYFGLQRNLEVPDRLMDVLDSRKDTSLFDLSNLYFVLSAGINYSLAGLSSKLPARLRNTELFLTSSFNSPFAGHSNNLAEYSILKYIEFGLGDIFGGFTTPFYNWDSFFSYFTFSAVLPAPRFTRRINLLGTVSGIFNTLYFIKKTKAWNVSLSSNHSFSHSWYGKASADEKGRQKNVPFDTVNSLSLLYRQSYSRALPSNLSLSASHYFGINTYKSRKHILTLGTSSSWKLAQRVYLNASVSWKDLIFVYHPTDLKVKKKEKRTVCFNLSCIYIKLGCSYSF